MTINKKYAYVQYGIGLALMLVASVASATMIYDAAKFEATIRGQLGDDALSIETFDSAALGQYKGGSPSLHLNDLTLYSSRFSIVNESRYTEIGGQAVKAVPGGWGQGDQGWVSQYNNYGAVNFQFNNSIGYFGLDVRDLGTSSGQSVLLASLDGGEPFELLRQGTPWGTAVCDLSISGAGCYNNEYEGKVLFAGIFSETLFKSVTLTLVEGDRTTNGGFVKDDYVGFDNLRYGTGIISIPNPPILALVSVGLLLLLIRLTHNYSYLPQRK
jgi:hypothetical protein